MPSPAGPAGARVHSSQDEAVTVRRSAGAKRDTGYAWAAHRPANKPPLIDQLTFLKRSLTMKRNLIAVIAILGLTANAAFAEPTLQMRRKRAEDGAGSDLLPGRHAAPEKPKLHQRARRPPAVQPVIQLRAAEVARPRRPGLLALESTCRSSKHASSSNSSAGPSPPSGSSLRTAELGAAANRLPIVTFVHGGPDPFLDRQFDAWLDGQPIYVALHQLLNRLCRQGTLLPGEYAVTRPA